MLAFDVASEFTREQVSAVAALANLDLDPSEIDLLARQLGDILTYADEVQRVDTTGVPPTATVVTASGADRVDEVRPSLDVEEALANAPDPAPDAGLFKVPRVIG
jgi:aspartyl-tRNA(Asn)/glutamyl-tRNA(Gln) amidotransferase subunit C